MRCDVMSFFIYSTSTVFYFILFYFLFALLYTRVCHGGWLLEEEGAKRKDEVEVEAEAGKRKTFSSYDTV